MLCCRGSLVAKSVVLCATRRFAFAMSARVCRSLASRALTVQARAVLPAGVSRCARSFSSLVRRVPRSVGSHVPTRWRRASIRSASTAPPQSMDVEAAAERPSAASGARMSPRVAAAAPSLGGQGGSASDVDVAGVTHAAVEPAPEGGGQVVTVEWASGDVAWFHGVWLRYVRVPGASASVVAFCAGPNRRCAAFV